MMMTHPAAAFRRTIAATAFVDDMVAALSDGGEALAITGQEP
jgi:hypothetical protein